MGTFLFKTFTWKPLLGVDLDLVETFAWQPELKNFGNLYLGTFTRERCGSLYHVTLATLGTLWKLCLGTLQEPSPWKPWQPWQPSLGNLGNLYFGNFGALYLATWEPLLGNLLGPSGICTWEPWGSSLASLYSELLWEPAQCNFGNFGSPVEPLLGNLAGTSTRGTLHILYEPAVLGNLDLGTFPREFYGNVYLGALETFI